MSFVEWLANGAVKDARQQNQIKLDYSGLHEQYAKARSTISVQGLGPALRRVHRRNAAEKRTQRDDAIGEKS